METLTIDGKNYISSKSSAEITGYAKDYIGQLCREGRVEARLIGRNWYILESSIRDHRFGTETNKEAKEVQTSILVEEATILAPEGESEPLEVSSNEEIILKTETENKKDNEVSDIQKIQEAWRTWFLEKEKVIIDKRKDYINNSYIGDETEDKPLIHTGEKEEMSQQDQEKTPLRIERSFKSSQANERVEAYKREEKLSKQAISRKSSLRFFNIQGERSLIIRSLSVVIMGLSLFIVGINTGIFDHLPIKNSLQAAAMEFIGGSTFIKVK